MLLFQVQGEASLKVVPIQILVDRLECVDLQLNTRYVRPLNVRNNLFMFVTVGNLLWIPWFISTKDIVGQGGVDTENFNVSAISYKARLKRN